MTFKIAALNCRGINNKLGEVKKLLYDLELDILCVSETKHRRFQP